MNSGDVADVLAILRDQRMAHNRSIQTYQRKLAVRIRKQIVSRAPQSSEGVGIRGQFEYFARWLNDRKLEDTYLQEGAGGQLRVRTLQMTAQVVRDLRSDELRQVLFNDGHGFLEPYEWATRQLEQQLNRWRGMPAAELPLRIEVSFAPLSVEQQYAKAVAPYGNMTLRFTARPNPNQLFA